MNKINWLEYKFHPSGLGNLMTNARKKDEILSETAKSYLRDLWIEEVWGRKKSDTIANKYMQKGIMCETDSIELLEHVNKKTYFKNNKQISNDLLVGTPDIIKPELRDIKTSYDLHTFMAVDETKARKDYYYQLLGYMHLTGQKTAYLDYCLVNTPEILVTYELYKIAMNSSEEIAETFKNNYVFDDIPKEKRVKTYVFEYSETDMQLLTERIQAARQHLLTISL